MTGMMAGVPEVCFCFSIHQPYRLNTGFAQGSVQGRRDPKEAYFSPQGREAIRRRALECYIPITKILLDWLDGGLLCAFSISGVMVEQLERWAPDALDLIGETAAHRNAEVLARTYYNSIAGLFLDAEEFSAQITLHLRLMGDLFHAAPRVFDHAGAVLAPSIASTVRGCGLSAISIEADSAGYPDINPNLVYAYGDLPVLVRNCTLSDDLAARFQQICRERYPLSADAFAGVLAAAPGDCIHLNADYAALADHLRRESGIPDFLASLPAALAERGIRSAHPSRIARHPPAGNLPIVQGAGIGGQMNMMQHSAILALKRAADLSYDRETLRILQATDYLRSMAMKSRSCGRPHHHLRQEEAYASFKLFMRILSDAEERSAPRLKSEKAAMALRCLPPDRAFHFSSAARPAGYSANSLDEFEEILGFLPEDVFLFHTSRNDFSRWIHDQFHDRALADAVSACTTREEMQHAVHARIRELWNLLK
ncbi:MAG: alpha-amylase [Methanomicrobiaceae archaeon]|uniref:Glycoside hydrolase family 57 N-terminal domain-containing protein n=1 Tax=hydrocarbon metagenome TaxID=938273 RepID=A0A0W8FGQ3_9ZZZZ|nr:alpha-amylase [Methanomicrobiaceae archaeon]MDD5419448.1 alpha-amylase [Methanomicrobiaceae archaeon]